MVRRQKIEYTLAVVILLMLGWVILKDRTERIEKKQRRIIAAATQQLPDSIDIAAVDSAISDISHTFESKEAAIAYMSRSVAKKNQSLNTISYNFDSAERKHTIRVAYLSSRIDKLSKDVDELKATKNELEVKLKAAKSDNASLVKVLDSLRNVKPVTIKDTVYIPKPGSKRR